MFRVPKTTMPIPTLPANTFGKQPKENRCCAYSSYECNQPCFETYTYCARHILEDPNAPFRQCCFIYNINGRKCQNAAPKLDRREVSYVKFNFLLLLPCKIYCNLQIIILF
jgi:hypothetical protein